MSHFTRVKTEFIDKEALVDALVEMGYSQLEFGEGLGLYGYQGDLRQQTAEIVIRRRFLSSASNDLGFHLTEDGSYEVIISEFDASKFPHFVDNLKQSYADKVVVKNAAWQGYSVESREQMEDGSIRYVMVKW